ncbi:MAG: hypothetical protein KGJ21_00670 [Pseudomonadota bacterium]|nr:hypothetical protein [Pseudomonadota bacterium]
MVATVLIVEKNSSGGTNTDKTGGTIRMKDADDANVDTNNPMVIPGSGSNYSFEKWLHMKMTVAPSVQLTNLKFYTNGTNGMGTGINLWAKNVTTFATPAQVSTTTGYTNAFSYTSAAPLALGAGPYTTTGEMGDHVVLAQEVQSTAAQGQTPSQTLTFSYDEI